jgi:hypothetical protein
MLCNIARRPGTDAGNKVETPMKLVAALVALLSAVCSSYKQDRPEAIIPSSPHTLSETCVEVQIGNEKAPSLGCLNRRLKQQVDRVAPSLNAPRSIQGRQIYVLASPIRWPFNSNMGRISVARRSRSGLSRPLPTLWQSIAESAGGFGAAGTIYRLALTL